MKTKSFAALAALFVLSIASAHAAPVVGFVRPTLGYTKPADNHYSGAGVFGVAGGVMVGKSEEHEFSFEFLGSGWTTNHYDSLNRWVGETTEVRVPILLNYRYYIRTRGAVSPYIGAGVGCEVTSFSYDYGRGRHYYHDDYYDCDDEDDSVVAFAAAGTAGLSISLGRFVDLDIGYRAMWQGGGSMTRHEYRRPDYRIETDSGWVHFVTIGASVRF